MNPSLLGIDAHDLAVAKAIAETGSVTGAAEALGYSQPAISQRLARMQRVLGVPVVERVGRGLRLTEPGRILARYAATVGGALQAARGEIDDLRGLRAGAVRIVGFPSASPTILPRLISVMAERAPYVTVSYVEDEPPEAVAAVREGSADIALTFSYPGDRNDPHTVSAQGLDVSAIGVDPLTVVMAEGHRAAEDRLDDLDAFAEDPWIAGCPRCRGHLLEVCQRAGFAPTIRFETDNYVAVAGLVAQGIGVATLPGLALASIPSMPGIVTRPLPDAESRTIHLVMPRATRHVPAIALVRETLVEVVREATASAREYVHAN